MAQFLDSPLPAATESLTCRELFKAWCVIRDCAGILNSRTQNQTFNSIDAIETRALIIRRDEAIRSVAACAEISLDKAKAIVQFLTCDLENLSSLFSKGLWPAPVVAIDDDKNLAIAYAPLTIGSAIRRVEGWLEHGGLSDHLSDARRGTKYESWVRATITSSLAGNQFLPNARCAQDSIFKANESGEQIDLLVKLGNLLIVGEVKCRLYPIESGEHYNYLRRLNEAGDQVVRKARWLEKNRQLLADLFSVSLEQASSLRTVPIVVTNQGAGFGLLVNGARVVDFHFLKLYLSDNQYVSKMAFDMTSRMTVPEHQTLYQDESDAAAQFEQTIKEPPPLKRLLASAVWRDNRFPMSNGETILVANCLPSGVAEDSPALRTVLSLRQESRGGKYVERISKRSPD